MRMGQAPGVEGFIPNMQHAQVRLWLQGEHHSNRNLCSLNNGEHSLVDRACKSYKCAWGRLQEWRALCQTCSTRRCDPRSCVHLVRDLCFCLSTIAQDVGYLFDGCRQPVASICYVHELQVRAEISLKCRLACGCLHR